MGIQYEKNLFNVFTNRSFNSFYKYSGELICEYDNRDFYHIFSETDFFYFDRELKQTLYNGVKLIDGKIGGNFLFSGILYIPKNKFIIALNYTNFKTLWQFDLSTLGRFEDRDGNLQDYEVAKFIGVWEESLLVACSGQMILDINIQTGEINRKWQELPGYGSTAFQGRLQHKLPSTSGFQLDISKSYLYHLAGSFLVKIDLVSGEASLQSLKGNLEKNLFSGFRWSTAYGEDETHIYTIAEMNGRSLGVDYTPQCIVAFNKSTLETDWFYRFEEDWIKSDIPQYSDNKLYQLSGNHILYVFEKEETRPTR